MIKSYFKKKKLRGLQKEISNQPLLCFYKNKLRLIERWLNSLPEYNFQHPYCDPQSLVG